MATLVRRTGEILQQALKPSTQRAYQRAWDRFHAFASSLQPPRSSLPALPSTIALFITSLVDADETLAAASIVSTISAISYRHKLLEYDPTSHFLVRKLLHSVSAARPAGDTRLPLTIVMLQQLIGVTSALPSPYEATLAAAMFATMYAALLRVGEVTQSPHNINFSNITLANNQLSITFVSYKHHNGRPVTLTFAASHNANICPVRLLTKYIMLRGESPGPLFAWIDGRAIAQSWFRRTLQTAVGLTQGQTQNITPHSFRIGAATHAAASGKSVLQIQAMGRWRSNAFLKYIRIPTFNM